MTKPIERKPVVPGTVLFEGCDYSATETVRWRIRWSIWVEGYLDVKIGADEVVIPWAPVGPEVLRLQK